jgi:predicted transcriptional regulator
MVGASRSKVTKLLSDLERRQIIVREKRKLVLINGNARKFLKSPSPGVIRHEAGVAATE